MLFLFRLFALKVEDHVNIDDNNSSSLKIINLLIYISV